MSDLTNDDDLYDIDDLLDDVPDIEATQSNGATSSVKTEAEVIDDLSWFYGGGNYDAGCFPEASSPKDNLGWFTIIVALNSVEIEGDTDGAIKRDIASRFSWNEYDRQKRTISNYDPEKSEEGIDDLFARCPAVDGGTSWGTVHKLANDARIAAGEPINGRPPFMGFDWARDLIKAHPEWVKEEAARASEPATEEKTGNWEGFEPWEFKNRPRPRWVIDALIREKATHVLFGDSETMKTFQLLELLGAVITGKPAFGKFEVFSPGDAIFFCDEDPDAVMLERWPAYCAARGIEDPFPFPKKASWHGRLLVLPRCPLIGTETDTKAAIEYVNSKGFKPVLAAIDTAAKAMAGLDQNDAKNAGLLEASMTAMRREWGCASIVTHHTQRADKEAIRGSGSFRTDFDIMINATRKPDTFEVQWTWQKMKSTTKPEPMTFKGQLWEVAGAFDQHGEQITAPVFDYVGKASTDATTGKRKGDKQDQEAKWTQTVIDVLAESGGEMPALAIAKKIVPKGKNAAETKKQVNAVQAKILRSVGTCLKPGFLFDYVKLNDNAQPARPYVFTLPPGFDDPTE
jgi:AAA domain